MNTIKNILLVEDEVLTAMSLKMELEDTNLYSCLIASSGVEAERFCDNNSIDIIIMDVNLPGKINGIEALFKIRKKWNLPAVFMTGSSDDDVKKNIDLISRSRLLQKPVCITCLLKAIREIE